MSRKNIPCFSLNKNLKFFEKSRKKQICYITTTWNNKNNGLQFETEN